MITVERFDDDGACIAINDRALVGTVRDDETGEMVVGHWPDGEEWVELFRVPSDWTHEEG